MALFLTAVLILSCIGMGGLLYVKSWEMRTGKMLLSDVRPQAARVLKSGSDFFEESLPDGIARGAEWWSVWLRTNALAALARALASAELALEKALHALRHKTLPPPSGGGQASAFLREVADYKKELLSRSREEGMHQPR